MRRVAPHLSHGLRAAALLDRSAVEPSAWETEHGLGPGVLVLDAHGVVQIRNVPAAEFLADLGDVGREGEAVPYAVSSVVAQLQDATRRDGSASLSSQLRVQGRSGRSYMLRASVGEPVAAGSSATIVLIEPAPAADVAVPVTRLHGLTSREREVMALAARGRSTKAIAAELSISPYTVQEHLGNACTKVGVRTRKELVAKLFFDAYAPYLTGSARHVG